MSQYDATMHKPEQDHECICPRCKKIHIVHFFWSGRGRPRKFCEPCSHVPPQAEMNGNLMLRDVRILQSL